MKKQRGVILFLALIVAVIMMGWAIAATQRTNFTTGAVGYGYRRSEAYYLAKTACSRALNQVNLNSGWVSDHNSRDKADTSTPGTLCWMDSTTRPGSLILRCEATVERQTEYLNVPLLTQGASDTHIYSVAPSLNGGPDLVAWSTVSTDVWETLPRIPGIDRITDVTSTVDMDVYAIGCSSSGETNIWRYRLGQGWIQMPDGPDNVKLLSLSNGGGKDIVCLGSDNKIWSLSLGADPGTAAEWGSINPPAGVTLTNVHGHPAGEKYAFATGKDGSGATTTWLYQDSTQSWSQYPALPATTYDVSTGAAQPASSVSDVSGGMAVTRSGKVYAASNPPSSATVIYEFTPTSLNAVSGNWRALDAVPALEWQADGSMSAPSFAHGLEHLKADEDGNLWAQWTNPNTGKFSTLKITP